VKRSLSKARPCRNSRVPSEYVEAYSLRAADLCDAGDAPGAIIALGKALATDPDNEVALLGRAALELLCGHPRKALRDLSRALSRNRRNPSSWFKTGQAHQALNQLRAAIADYSAALLFEPGHRQALLHRAVLYSSLNQVDRALSDFDRLMAADRRIAKALAIWGLRRILDRNPASGREYVGSRRTGKERRCGGRP
jgi:tetratricopeptide (TPR) repeat protein